MNICKHGSSAQYGMFALESIACDEVIVEIPRNLLLYQQTSAIKDLLNDGKLSQYYRTLKIHVVTQNLNLYPFGQDHIENWE